MITSILAFIALLLYFATVNTRNNNTINSIFNVLLMGFLISLTVSFISTEYPVIINLIKSEWCLFYVPEALTMVSFFFSVCTMPLSGIFFVASEEGTSQRGISYGMIILFIVSILFNLFTSTNPAIIAK